MIKYKYNVKCKHYGIFTQGGNKNEYSKSNIKSTGNKEQNRCYSAKNAKKRRVQQMPDKSSLAGNQGYIKAVDIVLSGTRAFSDDVQFWVGNWDYLYKNNLLGKYDSFNKFSTTHKESSEYVE